MRMWLTMGLALMLAAPLTAQIGGGGNSAGNSKQPPGFGRKGGKVRSTGDSGGETVAPEEIPDWNKMSSDILNTAALEKLPIVIYFPNEEDDNEASFSGTELAELSESDALFIRFIATTDREPNAWPADTRVPQNRLMSDNPARDFEVPAGKSIVLLCDWFGNEVQRFSTTPAASTLKAAVGKVADKVEDNNKKLQKNHDAAKASLEAGNRAEALKSIKKNFKDGLVGLDAQVQTIDLYNSIVDAAKIEAAELAGASDKAGLQKLLKEMKETDAEKAIQEELDKLS